jgi:hypothetical protein
MSEVNYFSPNAGRLIHGYFDLYYLSSLLMNQFSGFINLL